jgi:hypothetical protein
MVIRGEPYPQFPVRVWIPAEKRLRVFMTGRTLASAKRLHKGIASDPARAVEKRQRQADDARNGLTVAQLCKTFTACDHGRGATANARRNLPGHRPAL